MALQLNIFARQVKNRNNITLSVFHFRNIPEKLVSAAAAAIVQMHVATVGNCTTA